MRRGVFALVALALGAIAPRGDAQPLPAPIVVVRNVRASSFELVISATTTASCRVSYAPNVLGFEYNTLVVRAGETTHLAKVIGLVADTKYEVDVQCGQSSHSKAAIVRTAKLPGPLPALPQIMTVTLSATPKKSLAATFIATGTTLTACWWEEVFGNSSFRDEDDDCTQSSGPMTRNPRPGSWRFAMRNAAGEVHSTPVVVP
jgi:hypothetical protein